MIREHWFWFLLTAAALTWYSTITVYVAIRGGLDIRTMLRRLAEANSSDPEPEGKVKAVPRAPR